MAMEAVRYAIARDPESSRGPATLVLIPVRNEKAVEAFDVHLVGITIA